MPFKERKITCISQETWSKHICIVQKILLTNVDDSQKIYVLGKSSSHISNLLKGWTLDRGGIAHVISKRAWKNFETKVGNCSLLAEEPCCLRDEIISFRNSNYSAVC